MNILDAIDDPKVFASFFKADTWTVWRVFLRVLFALPLSDEQIEFYKRHSGRSAAPTTPFREARLVVGRRGGKSFVLATIAIFLACFKDWRPYLGPGEVATVMIIAADRTARVIMRYCLGLLRAVLLARGLLHARASGVKQFPRGRGHHPRARFACVLINRPVVFAFGQTGRRADIAE